MKLSGNTILITGGGSGIGRELAREFHALGNTVIVAGRTLANLEATIQARPGMHALTVDMNDPDAIRSFASELTATFPDLNMLINNAGVMTAENILEDGIDMAIAEAAITTNLLGPMRLTSALLPHLKSRESAALMNVTSGLAFVPLQKAPAYSATKAALHSWTVALRDILKETPVEVIEIIPPAVQTGLTPGQETRANYMPLPAFISETMANFQKQPTPAENTVTVVNFLRNAEIEGRLPAALQALRQFG